MKALVLNSQNQLEFTEKVIPVPHNGEALVRLKAAGLNRRDEWIRQGKYPNILKDVVLGSDGCGIVEQVADKENENWLGKKVIINPNINWGSDPACQSSDYSILGMPTDGTLAEYVVVPVHRLSEKPKHLTDEEAASLPLAGLTAFRALFRYSEVAESSKVLITGFGGGVGQLAGLFALATGAEVSVTSGNSTVLSKANELGAVGTYNYKEESWSQQAADKSGKFDLIIDSSGGDQFNTLIKLLSPGGRIVFYGSTNGLPENINLYQMFWKQVSIQGTSMGNDQEFMQMIDFVSTHKINPIIGSVRPFEESEASFDELRTGARFGKSVVVF